MFRPGLVSITFRKLPASAIVRLAAEAKLEGIEWGGDIHVPHGQIDTARQVAGMTRDAGLEVAAYGSYYRLGEPHTDLFQSVLDTACALGAPVIRVWAGAVASGEATQSIRDRIASDGRRISELAQQAKIKIACEWHGHSLTDTAESAQALFDTVGHANFLTYWQPRNPPSTDTNASVECYLTDMESALPRLAGLHVFHWDDKTGSRLPLGDGESIWKPCLRKAAAAQRGELFALLEFVLNDDPAQMLRDAQTLHAWLHGGQEQKKISE